MTETTTPEKKRKWLMPLLFVSLAANLLIAGIVVGWSFSDDRKDRPRGAIRGVLGEPFLRALPDEARQALRRDIAREGPRIRESRDALRERFEAMLVALQSDPFVPENVARLLKEQRQVGITRQEFGEELLLRRLSEMSVDQRKEYATQLENQLKNLRRR
ncbi:MAG: periplasmic heavy metal sensor [Paracoccaceae bacterium]